MLADIIAEIIELVPELGPYLEHPEVTEILVNANGSVYTEREGLLQPEPVEIRSINLEPAVQRIARYLNRNVDESQPLLETRLPDGSRVAAAFPPVSVGGLSLSIRRFPRRYSAEELVERQMLRGSELRLLTDEIEARHNILISGGTGTGKTTLLNALIARIPQDQRLVIIEDVAEISVAGRLNVVRLEAREAQRGVSEVTIRDCLRHALRQRPDRVIVGEVRGAAALDLLEAWNTGHSGSMATIHSDTAETALYRLANAAMQAAIVPHQAVHHMIADALQTVVHIVREADGSRRVAQLLRVAGYDAGSGRFRCAPLAGARKPAGRDETVHVMPVAVAACGGEA